MSDKKDKALAISGAVIGLLMGSSAIAMPVKSAENSSKHFQFKQLDSGYQLADHHEGKSCGDKECGDKDGEKKCGDRECSKKDGEKKCGDKDKAKDAEHKCGEGSCG